MLEKACGQQYGFIGIVDNHSVNSSSIFSTIIPICGEIRHPPEPRLSRSGIHSGLPVEYWMNFLVSFQWFANNDHIMFCKNLYKVFLCRGRSPFGCNLEK